MTVSSAAWILSAKALFLSIGAASMAFFLKVSVPLVIEFLTSRLPLLWSSAVSWLRPPYLYVVINAIILSIAASSRLHRIHEHGASPEESPRAPAEAGVPASMQPEIGFGGAPASEDDVVIQETSSKEEDNSSKTAAVVNKEQQEVQEEEEEFTISRSVWIPVKRSGSPVVMEYLPQPLEKPLASSRFVNRRPTKSSPEGGKALKVTRPKRQETFENTWKAITEGRPMPLTRHLRKSDTWANGPGGDQSHQLISSPQQQQKMRKSETFRDRTNELELLEHSPSLSPSPSPGRVRRAASPSHDELNRRVEAFIRKFNEEMRLQRQESLNHYRQMISR